MLDVNSIDTGRVSHGEASLGYTVLRRWGGGNATASLHWRVGKHGRAQAALTHGAGAHDPEWQFRARVFGSARRDQRWRGMAWAGRWSRGSAICRHHVLILFRVGTELTENDFCAR